MKKYADTSVQAEFATSEHAISSSPDICGGESEAAITQIRADFTNCALPADSLTGACIPGADNEPNDCGYGANLGGLCAYCAASSPNSTDSCCVGASAETRCEGVDLPTFASAPSTLLNTGTATPDASAAAAADDSDAGLTGGQVAGIVIGAVLGALALLALIIGACIFFRRKRRSRAGSVFNQQSPPRQGRGPQMGYVGAGASPIGLAPGGRVARMAALEGASNSSVGRTTLPPRTANTNPSYPGSSSEDYNDNDSPNSGLAAMGGRAPKRTGSLSSSSALALYDDPASPRTGSELNSSPDAVTSGQSEQLAFFKDYYSQDEIRPGDAVATLWAYQPRANDEFELERGDMLKVVGIWDDGWATGIRMRERAEDWDARKKEQRDSGVSNGSRRSDAGQLDGEIKAFPVE